MIFNFPVVILIITCLPNLTFARICDQKKIRAEFIFDFDSSDLAFVSKSSKQINCKTFDYYNRNSIKKLSVSENGKVELELDFKLHDKFKERELPKISFGTDYSNYDSIDRFMHNYNHDAKNFTEQKSGVEVSLKKGLGRKEYSIKTDVTKYFVTTSFTNKCNYRSENGKYIQNCISSKESTKYFVDESENESKIECEPNVGNCKFELKTQPKGSRLKSAKDLGCSAIAEALKIQLSVAAKSYGCSYQYSSLFKKTDPLWGECVKDGKSFSYSKN